MFGLDKLADDGQEPSEVKRGFFAGIKMMIRLLKEAIMG
jgi:hypothetical protein